MVINSNFGGSNSLQGVNSTAQPAAPRTANAPAPGAHSASLGADHATLSSAASGAAQIASSDEVRMDKVDGVKSAIEAGTYNVPAAAVASKMVDSMLGSGK